MKDSNEVYWSLDLILYLVDICTTREMFSQCCVTRSFNQDLSETAAGISVTLTHFSF